MKIINTFIIIIISLVFISGCSNEDFNPDFIDIPVVESYLHAGQSFELEVSRQVPYASNTLYSSDNLDSLDISINTGNEYFELVPIGEGRYTQSNISIDELNTFEIEFYYNNLLVSALTTIPKKPTGFSSSASELKVSDDIFTLNDPDELKFSWNNPDGLYYYLSIENMESNPTPVFENDNSSTINQFFKQEPTQSNSYSMKTRRFSHYGNHRVILYHINPDLAALYQENDNTSQNISNPPSEINNAFGIFSGINADTLYIDVIPN